MIEDNEDEFNEDQIVYDEDYALFDLFLNKNKLVSYVCEYFLIEKNDFNALKGVKYLVDKTIFAYEEIKEQEHIRLNDKDRNLFKKITKKLDISEMRNLIYDEKFNSLGEDYCIEMKLNVFDIESNLEYAIKWIEFMKNILDLSIKLDVEPHASFLVSETSKILIEYWEMRTKKSFPKNFYAPKENQKSKNTKIIFKSSGPDFVQGVLERLDPGLTFAEINTGLRKALCKPNAKSPEK